MPEGEYDVKYDQVDMYMLWFSKGQVGITLEKQISS